MAPQSLHGRLEELRRLRDATRLAASGRPQLTVLMGRRRVGKTFLVQHHIEELRRLEPPMIGCYHAATRLAEADEIGQFWASTVRDLPLVDHGDPPRRWSDLFDRLVDAAVDTPMVVALDEAPYLVDSSLSFPSELQRSWDRARHLDRPSHLHLVITGSALATISELVSSRGALYERADNLMRLEPFDVPTSGTFIGAPSAEVVIEAWAATGGYPLLLSRWDCERSALSNLRRLAADPMGPLASNASVMLLDLPEASSYLRVMTAIGRGATKASEVSSHSGARIERLMASLLSAGYVTRLVPIGERRGHPHYELADQYLRFWFGVLERDMQLIESGQGPAVINRATPRWDRVVADAFERAARDHLARLVRAGELDPDLVVGRWWTSRPKQIELDVVGIGAAGWLLVGEAKWKEVVTRSDLQQLRSAQAQLRQAAGARLAMWARDRFSPEVITETPGALLFTARDVVAPRGT